tara:strand:+ start:139 stop:969 length:831 start_codon:yes stop_codon:yes gene_type:complete
MALTRIRKGITRRIKKGYNAIRYLHLPYSEKILYGLVSRPWYGNFIYEAGVLGKALGHSKVSIIEFGVAGGNGLMNIEAHASIISKEIGVDFEIYGFDIKSGLPKSSNYKDMIHRWNPGSYKMDFKKLEKQLGISKLIIGDVKETIPSFFKDNNPAPIGSVMFDLDYYSSTKEAFKIFEGPQDFFLPRVNCYFDDVDRTNEYIGELCAIKEFNEENVNKKITPIYNFHHRYHNFWKDWVAIGNRMYQYHDFEHYNYNKATRKRIKQLPLSKKYIKN